MSFFNNLVGSINSVVDSVVDIYSNANTFPNTVIRLNGRNFTITKFLGEGGFSFVYLAQDEQKQMYAVKTIRCQMGKEVAANAVREAIITDRFQHPNIIKIVDMCMIKEEDSSKTVYIIMPFYKRGNIQDLIDKSNQLGKSISEKHILSLFRGVCQSVQAMVNYTDRLGVHKPWAHRDIKPANVLLSDDGKKPVLMDFGSARLARLDITDRKNAMKQQDDAAENCSMPFRAPELFDVKVGTRIDEKVDIWSLGCTLFSMAYGESPFEMTVNQQGGTMALAVLNRQFFFPHAKQYSKQLQDLISTMLNTDAKLRPDIDAVIKSIDKMMVHY
ncbi:kinase-like domain-containing protein [Helicostylum pulchrum]|nr:kinase-like domain-containing protein [Helicostylum pulchrum]